MLHEKQDALSFVGNYFSLISPDCLTSRTRPDILFFS